MPSFSIPFQVQVADLDPSGPIRRLVSARAAGVGRTRTGAVARQTLLRPRLRATYTTMSATSARAIGIPFPMGTSRAGIITASGARTGLVHDGELRVRFPQLPDRVFRLYCVFAEDVPPGVPPVFGLNDLLDVFRVTLDGTPRPGAPFGGILFETLA
jgi:hypothetical protein